MNISREYRVSRSDTERWFSKAPQTAANARKTIEAKARARLAETPHYASIDVKDYKGNFVVSFGLGA